MKLILQPPKKSLSKVFLRQRPLRATIERFKKNLLLLLGKVDEIEREENQKNHIMHFLRDTYYQNLYEINTKDTKDLVIHTGKTNKDSVGVIIEAKRPSNKLEMVSKDRLNCKAFQELVLYYLDERIEKNNIDVKFCIATNIYEWFIFDASYFEKYFYRNKEFVKKYEQWRDGKLVTKDRTLFYHDIVKPYIDSIDEEILCTYFDIRDYDHVLNDSNPDQEKNLIALYKLLSPTHLLRISIADDSNKLDEKFYKELLYIIGLEEVKEGSKHIIRRKEKDKRDAGSLLENAISKLMVLDSADRVSDSSSYGENKDEKNFTIALELCITWINRILFLKLLEAQLIKYHNGNSEYKFLTKEKLKDFDEVFSLFHHVLAVPAGERDKDVKKKFELVPYLNSTLFEISPLERETINISSLNDSLSLDLINNSILKDPKKNIKSFPALEYILKFLDAFDFSSEGMEDIQEENRTLINASVLGKVFEKINGYKDGSIFTPGFITMYMCREAIRPAIVQKFKDKYNWKTETFDDLKNFIADKRSREDIVEFNGLINSLKICDPAVGSGHFLVSSLNEMIAIKSELGIFADEYGVRIPDYDISVEQDELVITDRQGDFFEYKLIQSTSSDKYKVKQDIQKLQVTLFHEKQKLIENCLFGVDINPNSVKICRLRLWIELLKNAYYQPPPDPLLGKEGEVSSELETLPNIDINIKCGNSLISRFPLDANLSKFGAREKNIIEQYRTSVRDYKNEKNRDKKKELEDIISKLKTDIRTDISEKDPKLVKLMNLKGQLDNLENQTGLFEQTKKDQKEQSAKKKKLETELAKIRKEVDDIKSNAIYKNAFEWRFEFPEVLNSEGEYLGFDVVIGNPPYISIQDLKRSNSNIADFYRRVFSTVQQGNYDIYIPFIELLEIISNKSGGGSYILPSKFFTTDYGELIRNYLLERNLISSIIDFEHHQVFENATIYTCLIFLNKKKNTFINYLKSIPKNILNNNIFSKVEYTDLQHKIWTFSNQDVSKIFKKIFESTIRLLELPCEISRGSSTGNDKIFLFEKQNGRYMNGYGKIVEVESSILIKPIYASDFTRYLFKKNVDWFLLFPYNNIDKSFSIYSESILKENFPLAYKYLMTNKEILLTRKQSGPWYGYSAARSLRIHGKSDILIPLLADKGLFTMTPRDNDFTLMAGGGFSLTIGNKDINSKFLLALLNSKLLFSFLYSQSNKFRGGYITCTKQYFENMPIKIVNIKEQKPFIDLVDQILDLKKESKDTTALEDKIDKMVYELYGLTEEEIKIVDKKNSIKLI